MSKLLASTVDVVKEVYVLDVNKKQIWTLRYYSIDSRGLFIILIDWRFISHINFFDMIQTW